MALKLVLASSSPRRAELLSRLGLSFNVLKAEVDETALEGEAPVEMVTRLSRAKAEAAASLAGEDAIVLAADTIVALEGRILGKPRTPAEARRMLRELRGRYHTVFTGVTVLAPGAGLTLEAVERSEVLMRRYSDAELEGFVASGRAMDKAGAYAVQDDEFRPVERIEGCYTNVMGLPVCVATRLLAQAGLELPGEPLALCLSLTPEEFRGGHPRG